MNSSRPLVGQLSYDMDKNQSPLIVLETKISTLNIESPSTHKHQVSASQRATPPPASKASQKPFQLGEMANTEGQSGFIVSSEEKSVQNFLKRAATPDVRKSPQKSPAKSPKNSPGQK